MSIELGDNLRKMLLDDGPGLTDCIGILGSETNKLGHVTKKLSGIFSTLLGGDVLLACGSHDSLLEN
jgi:hypothetical protein